jgi:hypothetical protein
MIGERPKHEEFEKLFDWPEAVTQLPYDSCDIDTVIKDPTQIRNDRTEYAEPV